MTTGRTADGGCRHYWVLFERVEHHVSLDHPRFRREWHELWYCAHCRTEDTTVVEAGIWARGETIHDPDVRVE